VRLLRIVPWLLVIAGLAVPVSQSPELWPFAVFWLVTIGLAWLAGRALPTTRMQRMSAAVIILPLLFLFGWWGGWWLIPADLAWLLAEALDRDGDRHAMEPVA